MESWLRQHLSPNLRDSQRDVSEHRGSMAMEPYCSENEYLHRKVQEEGIHVGCLPSAAVAVLGGGLPRGGVSVRGFLHGGVCPGGVCLWVCTQVGGGGVHPVEGVSTQWRGCLPVEEVSTQCRGCLPSGGAVCLGGVCPPQNQRQTTPPCRQNDRLLWKHYLSATTVADGKNKTLFVHCANIWKETFDFTEYLMEILLFHK